MKTNLDLARECGAALHLSLDDTATARFTRSQLADFAQRITNGKDAEIAALRQDALIAASVAFSMMVIDRPDELPEDAQAVAQWVETHVFPLMPPDPAGPEEMYLYIIRKAMAQAAQP